MAFGRGVIDRMTVTTSESAHVKWRERLETHLDPEAPQSRDWHGAMLGSDSPEEEV